MVDQPISRPDQTSRTGRYVPVNYDEGWHGTVTLRSALANSYNIPALLVQEAVGTKEVIAQARRLGVTTDSCRRWPPRPWAPGWCACWT